MRERRAALGGYLPKRVVRGKPLKLPGDAVYDELKRGSGKQPVATTMAFVRLLKDLMKDPEIGNRFVPIIPDEARTFGMDSLFPTRQDLLAARADLRGGGPGAAAVLQGVRDAARSCTRGSARRARWAR